MATKKAVASGLWSSPATWDGGTLPSPSDDVYANNFSVTIDSSITALTLRNTSGTGITAGGSFSVGNGIDVVADLYSASSNLLVFSNVTTTASHTGNVLGSPSGYTVQINSTCTGNVTLVGNYKTYANYGIGIASAATGGTVTIVGTITGGSDSGYGGSSIGMSISGSNTTYNMTGTISGGITALSAGLSIGGTGNIFNHVGNATCGLVSTTGSSQGILVGVGNSYLMVGNATALSGSASGSHCITSTTATYIRIVGAITASRFSNGLYSTSTSAVNLLSGPFISNQYGTSPVQAFRMNLIPTIDSEYVFYDDSTSGSLVASGVAYTLYPPSAAIDAPAEEDVREGTVYALATQTGTLAVPPAAAVAIGVPVDDTVGEAWLDPADVSEMMAAQMAAFLNGL